MKNNVLDGREIIIEFFSIGSVVKVSAVDVLSMTEISIQGPANTAKAILQNNAIKRLEYVLRKNGVI